MSSNLSRLGALAATSLLASNFLLAAPGAEAATIEKIVEKGGVLVLKLDKEERKNLAKGDQISVATPAGKPVEGVVLSVKGSRARVAVTAKKGTFKAGRSVQVASSAPAMTVSPQPASEAPMVPIVDDAPRTAGFVTHAFHPSMVNPAQLYQTRGTRTDFALVYSSETVSMKADAYELEAELKGPTLKAGVAWDDPRRDLTLALAVGHQEVDGRIDFDLIDMNDSFTITETSFAPMAAYAVRPGIQAGLTLEVVQRHHSGEFYDGNHNLSWARPRPGVTVTSGAGEAGIAWAPKVNEESTVTGSDGSKSTVAAREPVQTFLHGRGRLPTGGGSVYGVVTHNQNRVFNTGDETGWRNNANVVIGTVRPALGDGTEIDLAATASTPAHAGNQHKTPDNVIHYGGRLGFERRTEAGRFGAAVRYSTARDRYDDETDESVKLAEDEMALEVSGALKL